MKAIKLLILMLSLIATISCKKDNPEEIKRYDVEKYIELLKANQYDASELPAFTSSDIPALLQYRNETQVITNFPHNMVSSLGMPDCKLGMYVLWSIESIRAVAIKSEYLIGRFPSQNPIVQKKEDWSWVEDNNEVHQIVSQAYFDWWETNQNKDFNEFKNVDPLKNTDYKWH
ncbi:MAG TPA: hypothetical protein DCL77_18315 [Prolixibacteraceae bacterium]|jgi:translation elongation factor EF-Tu-like GTPase|nr:hypothetical protein [Prolixibacteraceae bacterium]